MRKPVTLITLRPFARIVTQTIRQRESSKKKASVNDLPKVETSPTYIFILNIPIRNQSFESNRIKKKYGKKLFFLFFHQSNCWSASSLTCGEFRHFSVTRLVSFVFLRRRVKKWDPLQSLSHAIQHVMHRWMVKHPVNLSRTRQGKKTSEWHRIFHVLPHV